MFDKNIDLSYHIVYRRPLCNIKCPSVKILAQVQRGALSAQFLWPGTKYSADTLQHNALGYSARIFPLTIEFINYL